MAPIVRMIAGLASIAAVGCSILLSPSAAKQCDTDSDCESEPALRGLVCRSGACSPPAGPSLPVAADGGQACTDSVTCTKANSGKASVCKQAGSPCIQWQTSQCETIAGDWADPNVIMIGAIFPLHFKQKDGSAPAVKYAERQRIALKLALDDVVTVNPWFIVGNNVRRPLGLLVCDSYGDPELARSAFDHLTSIVGAQAIVVGFGDDLEAMKAKATEKQVAIACSDCLAPLPPGPLAWRMIPQIADEASMVANRVAALEQKLGVSPLKVTLLKEFGLAQDAFEQALFKVLRINGDLATNQTSGSFQILDLPDGRKTSYVEKDYTDKIIAHGSHIVISAMGPDFPSKYLSKIEEAEKNPHYILTSLSRDSVELFKNPLAISTSTNPLRSRISGTRPYLTPEIKQNYDAFTAHFKPNALFQNPDGAEAAYDAFFSLFYAIASATTEPVLDGPHISSKFENLMGTKPIINVGTAQLSDAIGLLTKKQSIDLRGNVSSLDWDKATHELAPDVGMWCFKADGTVNDNAGPRYLPAAGPDPFSTGTAFTCD